MAVDGTYDQVNRLCSELADNDDYRWAFVNINMRPYYAEGSKTLGYEVAEQLGWRLPDHVVVPSASGAMFTKIWKGFNELACLGLLDGVEASSFGTDQNTVHHPAVTTQMHMAQAEGCSPIVSAWDNDEARITPVRPDSLAKSLAIGNPADGIYSLRVINNSGGSAYAVPEDQIVRGHPSAGGDRGHLHRDSRWRYGVGAGAPCGAGRHRGRRAHGCLHHRQRPEDAGGGGGRGGEPAEHQADDHVVRGGAAGLDCSAKDES